MRDSGWVVACSAALRGWVVGEFADGLLISCDSSNGRGSYTGNARCTTPPVPVSQNEGHVEEQAANSEGMWMHGILGMAELGMCSSKSGCNGTQLPTNLVPALA
jgi:hypothetical protein